jgi:hypothetical protein
MKSWSSFRYPDGGLAFPLLLLSISSAAELADGAGDGGGDLRTWVGLDSFFLGIGEIRLADVLLVGKLWDAGLAIHFWWEIFPTSYWPEYAALPVVFLLSLEPAVAP